MWHTSFIISLFYLLQTFWFTSGLPSQDKTSTSELSDVNPTKWRQLAIEQLKIMRKLVDVKVEPPKNVILFIGDGMSGSTVTGARYLKAQQANALAGDVTLFWENWPAVSLVRTFSANSMVTDSAASATAFLSGTKVPDAVIGISGLNRCCVCETIREEQKIRSILVHAQQRGLSTGIVTTTRITHATPASAYAHIFDREWESDTNGQPACEDGASQFISNGLNFNVVFGGGAGQFYQDNNTEGFVESGRRTDGRNLFQEWKEKQSARGKQAILITNRTQLMQLNQTEYDNVLGIFAHDHLRYDVEREEQPSLAEMTETAIGILSQNPKGYLLLVEGGRIDHGHHVNRAQYALTDALAMERAVELVANLTNPNETLIIVTADHSHAYGIIGSSPRNQSIFDIDVIIKDYDAQDGLPYLISTYFNGPGAAINEPRKNPDVPERLEANFQQQSLVPLFYSTHAADDVPLYAIGPFNELFYRAMDNTYIAHAIMYSLCIGTYEKHPDCLKQPNLSSLKSYHSVFPILTMSSHIVLSLF